MNLIQHNAAMSQNLQLVKSILIVSFTVNQKDQYQNTQLTLLMLPWMQLVKQSFNCVTYYSHFFYYIEQIVYNIGRPFWLI